MKEVWVIYLPYDGVLTHVGFFKSEEDAQKWVELEHKFDKERHEKNKREWPEDDWGEYEPWNYCVTNIELNTSLP